MGMAPFLYGLQSVRTFLHEKNAANILRALFECPETGVPTAEAELLFLDPLGTRFLNRMFFLTLFCIQGNLFKRRWSDPAIKTKRGDAEKIRGINSTPGSPRQTRQLFICLIKASDQYTNDLILYFTLQGRAKPFDIR